MKKRTSKPKTVGHRVGTKRRDMRWQDAHGEIWASRFESLVYESGRAANLKVNKCDIEGDHTVSYHSTVRGGVCGACGSADIRKEHRYTPDLCVLSDPQEGGEAGKYYVEAKGYIRAPQRALLRSLCKEGAIADLRFILQTDFRINRNLTFGGWINKFLHCKWAVWDGTWPKEWSQHEARTARKAIRKVS